MKKIMWLLVLSVVFIAGCNGGYSNQATGAVAVGEVKEFSTVIRGYNYDPSTINVNYGDTVIINIKNDDRVGHGISLPTFGVRESVGPGQTKRIQFIASPRESASTFCSTDHGEKLLIKVT